MPISRLHLDWETRSACDLKRAGVYAYAAHPTTDILCAAYCVESDNATGPVQLWQMGEPMPAVFQQAINEQWEIWAHNAQFEREIWLGVATRKYRWPAPKFDQWVCTAAAAAAMALPRDLDGAAAALGVQERKDALGHRLMMQVSQPRKQDVHGNIVWWEDAIRLGRLYEYCKQDIRVELQVGHRTRPLPPTERRIWLLDQKINARGVRVDKEGVYAAQWAVRRVTDKYNTRLRELTHGAIGGVTNNADFVKWLNANGVATDTVNKLAVQGFMGRIDLPPVVRGVLQIRIEAAKTSNAKLKQFEERISADGRMRDNLMYHGANTGRWAGRGAQLQNLPRTSIDDVDWVIRALKNRRIDSIEMIYGPPLDVISKCLRAFLIPDPGRKFIASDFSAIEARITAWAAGQDDLVRAFANNEKIYERQAASIFRMKIDDIGKSSVERQVGKATVLGAGFGMGKDRFLLELEKLQLPDDWDLPELAERSITAFRTDNDRIVSLWRELEKAAISAVMSPGTTHSAGPVSYFVKGGVLWCRLPSGRLLSYVRPSIEMKRTPWGEMKPALHYWAVDSVTRKWVKQDTYGGALCENIAQAIARDLMAEGMLRLEATGLPVVLTVHDEIVVEPLASVSSAKEVDDILSVVPPWASGLPLKAEGWEGDRYRK